ncbi:MAG: ester cyclase [Bacteroidota bacterium]
MKNFCFILSVGVFLFIVSCNDQEKSVETDMTAKNIAAINEINKAIETGDVSRLGDYITTDAVDHAGPKGDIKGLDSIKASLAQFHAMVQNMKLEVLKEIADNEYVFQWVRFTGITTTIDMGMPVGTKFDMTAIELAKMKDGKVAEHWEFMQPIDMLKMAEPITLPSTSKKDTLKNKIDSLNMSPKM